MTLTSQEWAVLSDSRLQRAQTVESFRSKKIRALSLLISGWNDDIPLVFVIIAIQEGMKSLTYPDFEVIL